MVTQIDRLMKIKTIQLYTFDELSKEAKQKALESLYDINVDYDNWYYCEPDFQIIDLKSFDLYRREIEIDFRESAEDTARTILEEYGNKTDEYALSKAFIKEFESCTEDGYCDDCDEHRAEYKNDLAQCYLSNLQKQYDYLTSDEAIIETITANEYYFTGDGKLESL